jgi:hypothetical protein
MVAGLKSENDKEIFNPINSAYFRFPVHLEDHSGTKFVVHLVEVRRQ